MATSRSSRSSSTPGTPSTSGTPRKKAAAAAPAPVDHAHEHVHSADGTCCAHGHEHPHGHDHAQEPSHAAAHGHGAAHSHDHDHEHGHVHAADGSCCGHAHDQGPRHIYIYSPAGAVRDKAGFKRGVRRLEAMGHQVEIDADALSSHQRFAGDDATRLAAIERAAASGADLALPTRGGYGLTRILPGIKYKAVAKAIAGGTRFVGLSDFTALSLALLARTGATTWAGPLLVHDFGRPDDEGGVDDIMLDCFNDLLSGQGEGAGWQMPKIGLREDGKPAVKDFYISGGATLWGGNLAVLVSLLGTPYFPQIQGGILFLEDVGEHPYRVERMLTQLLHAGVLARQKAIVFGQFSEFKLSSHDKGFKLQTVIDWLRSQVKCPVLQGLPYGHVPTKVMLPVGAPVSLSVEGRDALIYWGHVH